MDEQARMNDELMEVLEFAAYRTIVVCDMCNRHPGSTSDGVKLCAQCRVVEYLHDGDLGAAHETMKEAGLA